jgi:hypothetical protein
MAMLASGLSSSIWTSPVLVYAKRSHRLVLKINQQEPTMTL